MKLDSQLKIQKQSNQELNTQIEQLQQDILKSREQNQRAEQQIEELKEKLRIVIREQQEERIQAQLLASTTSSHNLKQEITQQSNPKYEELLHQILSLSLAPDPLTDLLLSSGSSSITTSLEATFEQAKRHLSTQAKLVKSLLQHKEQQYTATLEQLKEAQTCLESTKEELRTARAQCESEHTQVIEVMRVEMLGMRSMCERQNKQQREVEELNSKLRSDIEQANSNLKKALRAQDKLVKPSVSNFSQTEMVQMHQKDLLCQFQIVALEQKNQQVVPFIPQHQRVCSAVQTDFNLDPSTNQVDQSISLLNDLQHPNIIDNQEYQTLLNEKAVLEQTLSQAEGQIHQLMITIDQFRTQELEIKNQCDLKVQYIEEQSRQKQSDIWNEVEQLKSQVQQELNNKSVRLDQEYEELMTQKQSLREDVIRQQRELDMKYAERQLQLESEFFKKLQQVEVEIKKSSEQSKEATISNLYQQLKAQTESQIEEIQTQHSNNLNALKTSNAQAISDLKAKQARELKSQSQETASLKKQLEDRLSKLSQDHQLQLDQLENQFKDKLESEKKERVKAVTQARDKVKAESRNQVDMVKNEMARARAEHERQLKAKASEWISEAERIRRECAEASEIESRNVRDKTEKAMKKKVDEAIKEGERKVKEVEKEVDRIREMHKEEIKKERERVESMLREQVRIEVRDLLGKQFEEEYREQLEKINKQHQQELDRIKNKHQSDIQRVEKACQLPTPHKPETRFVEVQCEILQQEAISGISAKQKELFLDDSQDDENVNDIDNTGLVIINNNSSSIALYDNDNILDYARQQNQPHHSSSDQQHKLYVQQLKSNYEAEMERQLQVFEMQLIQKQENTVRIFEELMTLEFDKILQSLFAKSNPQQSTSLESRRRDINNLINDILMRNDDRRGQQMRASLDALKGKINEVLRLFKQELDTKFNKKMQAALELARNEQNQKKQMQYSRDVSEIVSSSSCKYPFSQMGSDEGENLMSEQKKIPIQPHSPNIKSGVANHLEHFAQEQAQQQLFYQQFQNSDVKNYVSQDQQENNFPRQTENNSGQNALRKIVPLPNSKGVLVVEVDKVFRDLQMLLRTMRNAKFYKIIMEEGEEESGYISPAPSEEIDPSEEQRGSNHEASLQKYRQVLNSLMRSIVKLNQSIEGMAQSNELYRIKLYNAELRDQLKRVSKQLEDQNVQVQVDNIISFYIQNTQPNEMLSKDGHLCLQALEAAQFAISKQHFKMFKLRDIFMLTSQNTINRNILEVNKLCSQFLRDHPEELNSQSNQLQSQSDLLQSQAQYSPSKIKIIPELLSPEETAQLVANVFQRVTNQSSLGTTTNIQFPSAAGQTNNNSFFQTFLSNEDNIRCAENFIQRYREQLMGHTNRSMDLPIQMLHRTGIAGTQILYQSHDSSAGRYRSHSGGSSQGAVDTRRQASSKQQMGTITSNVFLKNAAKHTHSTKSINKSIVSTAVSKANQPYQSIQLKGTIHNTQSTGSLFNLPHVNTTSTSNNFPNNRENYNTLNLGSTLDELSNVQSNLNLMMEKAAANNNKSGGGQLGNNQNQTNFLSGNSNTMHYVL